MAVRKVEWFVLQTIQVLWLTFLTVHRVFIQLVSVVNTETMQRITKSF